MRDTVIILVMITIEIVYRRYRAMSTKWVPVPEWVRKHPEAGQANHVYEMCRKGVLRSVRVGGKILIAEDALEQLADEQAQTATRVPA